MMSCSGGLAAEIVGLRRQLSCRILHQRTRMLVVLNE